LNTRLIALCLVRKAHVILLVVALLGLAAAGCGGGTRDVPDNSVAIVGGADITKAEFDALMDRARSAYKGQKREFPKVGTPEYKTLQNQAVQYLVQQEKYRQAAADMDIKIEEKEINARLEQVKKQYFGASQKEYEKNLKAQGLTDEQVRREVENQLISEKIYAKITEGVKVTDEDIQEHYEKNKKDYKVNASREVRHILVSGKPLADRLHGELQNGGNFAALAKRHSKDPGSKANGGKLTVRKGETVPPFDKAAFSLKKGELSTPIKTTYGWHIIEALSDVKPPTTTPLKDVKEQIRQQLLQERRQKAVSDWTKELNKDFDEKIAYQVGYAPPSTNQTTTASQ
jgi:parvulin-like peptidyl-prolyl isomerase